MVRLGLGEIEGETEIQKYRETELTIKSGANAVSPTSCVIKFKNICMTEFFQ
jgi:hypothetical protein